MIRRELGRIQKAEFGFGGYQDVMIGVSFTLGGESWGVSDFWGEWTRSNTTDEVAAHKRTHTLGELCFDRIPQLLKVAKVKTVDKLVGIPVEVVFDCNVLQSWRVLTEVL